MTLYTHYDLDTRTDRNYRTAQMRHAVRKVYREAGYLLKEIQYLEGKETGITPDHSTVIHSCRNADPRLVAVVKKTAKALRLFR
jgi:hypothetical protein